MKLTMKQPLVTLLVVLLGNMALAADSVFKSPPSVTRNGSGMTVAFELKRSTDVEVAVLDARRKVVRHLAAGVVGGRQAAPPLQAGSLSQSIVWDGKGDAGKPVTEPVAVRVRTGLRAKLGRLIGGSPYRGRATVTPYRGSLQGVAVDDEGNVFVKMMSDVGSHGNTGLWPWQIRKFDSQGKYIETLLPYPPSTARAKANGYTLIDTGDGHFTPANQNSLYPVFSIFGSAIYQRIRPGGELVFINSQARVLTFFKVDGSNAVRQVAMWPKEAEMPAPAWLDFEIAFSPDGRYAYYSNVARAVLRP